jgi:hypothetical protein
VLRWKAPIVAILASLFASIAIADDFKTIDGKEYKNAKVSRVEPDGLVLMTKSGISKVYFAELPKEVQERYHYGFRARCAFHRRWTFLSRLGESCGAPVPGKKLISGSAKTMLCQCCILLCHRWLSSNLRETLRRCLTDVALFN